MRFSFLCVFVALFMMCVGLAGAQTSVKPSGTGTTADPYQIKEIGNFAWLKMYGSAEKKKYYKFMNDIDASETSSWNGGAGLAPIGTEDVPFEGYVDGNNKKMTGLVISRSSAKYVGLFGYVVDSTFKDLGMVGGRVVGDSYVGLLAGYLEGSLIANCYSTGEAKGNDVTGGLVGKCIGTMISDCYATGDVSGWDHLGGLIGSSEGTIKNCYAICNVTCTRVDSTCVGGLVGLSYCGSLTNCFAMCEVQTDAKQVGGLAGQQTSNYVTNCFSTSNVSGKYDVGGLIGRAEPFASGCTITNCYAAGAVSGNNIPEVGGLVGSCSDTTFVSSYYDKQTTGRSDTGKGMPKTTAEMKQQATFVGWDFESLWGITDGATYPMLRFYKNVGSLKVTITPTEAVSAGAAWSIDDGATWNASGVTLSDLPAAKYLVIYKSVTGWTAPYNDGVDVTKDATAEVTGGYTRDKGGLSVTITPAAAVSAGAQWSVDDGATWNASEAIVSDLPTGTITVSFKTIKGWTAPTPQSVTILKNKTVGATGEYVQQKGSLKVTLAPATAITAGAQWSIDSGATWHNSGETVADLSLKGYKITGKDLDGWVTPIALVNINSSSLYTKTLTYVQQDLVMQSGNFTTGISSPLTPGDKVDFSWTVTAAGAVNKPVWCEIFASKTGGFDQVRTGATITSSYKASDLSKLNKIAPETLTLNSVSDGVYTLMPSVNRGSLSDANRAGETNYVNNWKPLAGKRLAVRNTKTSNIDLQLANVAIEYDPANPAVITFRGKVKNAGTANLTKPGAWVEVFCGTLTAEGVLMPQGTIGAGQNINTLAAGATADFTLPGIVPAGVANRALAVIVDSTDIVPETNEVNNSQLVYDPSILPPGKDNGIDLAIKSVTVNTAQLAPNQVAPESKLKYSVTVQNKGTVMPSDKVYLELFASQDGGVSNVQGVTLTWSEKITAPALGETKTYNFEKTINSIGDGMYTLVAVVNRAAVTANPGDKTPLDNKRAFSGGRVSLSTPTGSGTRNIVWSEGPTFTQNGSKVTVSGKIKNTGNSTTRAFWTEAFIGTMQAKTGYFYKDTNLVFSAGDNCAAGLAPNEERTITLTGTVPADKIIGVLADSTDVVAETDETDNYDYSIE